MADNIYDFDALIAAGTRFVTDDGSGNDTIVLSQARSISQAAIDNGNYAVRIFLTSPSGTEGTAYGEVMQTDPLLYLNVTFTGLIENIYGAAGRELYSGNSARNYIQGDGSEDAGGDDQILGLGGNDTLVGAGGSDLIYGGNDDDLIYGDIDLELEANIAAGDDSLRGDAGNDTLIGGFGTNSLQGGDGFDTGSWAGFVDTEFASYSISVNLATAVVAVTGIDSYDGFQSIVATDHVSSIERFVGTGMADVMQGAQVFTPGDLVRITFEGAGGDDTLTGGAGADVLYGGAGADRLDAGLNGNIAIIADLMAGGTGNDTYLLHAAADIVEAANEGIDTVISDFSMQLGYNLERLVLSAAAGNANATGNALDNHLIGNAGANILDGQGGSNTLEGGAGNDTYLIRPIDFVIYDAIIEAADGGIDTVLSDGDGDLASFDNVENLTLLGSGDSSGRGNALANRITGTSGNNTLRNWGENDTLIGGAGNDIYAITAANTVVIEEEAGGLDTLRLYVSGALAAGVENLALELAGLAGTGNALDNRMTATTGNETLTGLAGDDQLFGGAGNDLLSGGGGSDRLRADAGDDALYGGAGADVLVMTGARAVTVDLAQTTAQATGYGTDTILGVENVIGGDLADLLRGNAAANQLYGGAQGDDLLGAAGDDGLFGGAGDDLLHLDLGNDTLSGGADSDTVAYSGALALRINLALTAAQDSGLGLDVLTAIENIRAGSGNDTLRGNGRTNDISGGAGADTIHGGGGADYLHGEAGNDLLFGGMGGGSDLFLFGSDDGNDRIADFEDGVDLLVMGNPADVLIQDAGAHTLLIYGNTQVTLVNIDHLQITLADFLAP